MKDKRMFRNRVSWVLSVAAVGLATPLFADGGGKNADRSLGREQRKAETSMTFRAASSRPVSGYERVAVQDAPVAFVAPSAGFTTSDIVSASNDAANGSVYAFQLASGLTAGMGSGVDLMAIYLEGELASVVPAQVAGDVVTLDVSAAPASLGRKFAAIRPADLVPEGPAIYLLTREGTARPGELINVDVFLSKATDLRAYQVALDAFIGQTPASLAGLEVDNTREDYVFAGVQAVHAVDPSKGRLTSAMYQGGINVNAPAYLGTFTYRLPAQAAGTVQVRIRSDRTTLLRNSAGRPIGYQIGEAAQVSLGVAAATPKRR